MRHYLQALKYASEPEDDWGPANKENQYGLYESLKQSSNDKNNLNNGSITDNGNLNNAFDPEFQMSSRF